MKPEIASALKLLDAEPHNPDALAALAAAAEGGGNGKSDPAAARALAESRRVHRDRGDLELVARLFDLELGWERDPARRAELLSDKGRLLLDEIFDERAAEECFTRALAEEKSGKAEPRAEEALAQLRAVRESRPRILAKYLAEAQGATDRALQASLYVSAAELVWKGKPGAPEVEEHLRKALAVDVRNRKAAAHLERFLRGTERWEPLAALYAERVEIGGTPKDEKIQLLLQLAEVQREALHRADLARATLERVLALDAANPRAVRAMAEAYEEEGDWLDLVHLYENALKARRGETDEVRALLVKLGGVLFEKLGQGEAAEVHFARVRKTEPGNRAMLDFYRAFHGERGEGARLLVVLGQAQKVESDPRRRFELSLEMAEIAEEQAGNADKAIEIWKGILRTEPGSERAQAALKRLFVTAQKWNALLELLKEQVERVELPAEPGPAREEAIGRRVSLLFEIAEIYQTRLSLDVMVVNTFNAILGLKPDHQQALAQLAAKYEQMGRWNDLINTLGRTVEQTGDVHGKAALLRRIAGLWLDKFGNQNQAVKPLEELYALGLPDPDTAARLRDIYARRRAWRQLIDLERRELQTVADWATRRGRLIEMARLAADKLGDAREAIGLWNHLLEEDERDAEALAALAALYEREKRYPALVEVLRRQRSLLSDARSQVALLEKLGVLAAEKLAAHAIAAEAYREILAIQPGNPKALRLLRELLVAAGDLEGLEELYGLHGQWEELCETLLHVADKASDVAHKTRINFRVAEIARERLKQPERAIKAYERVLLSAAQGAEVPQITRAAEALARLYQQTEKWPRLLGTYEAQLSYATTDEERFALYGRIAALCEEKLGSRQQAFQWIAKAYRLHPGDAVLEEELVRLGQQAEAHEELAELLGEQVAAQAAARPAGGGEAERLVARRRQLGELLAGRLNRPDEARVHFEAVLAARPGDAQALEALERIHTGGGDHEALLALYRTRLEHAATPAARVELLFRIAWIEEEQASDLDGAARTYERILAEDPRNERALRALERIYALGDRHEELASTLARQLDLSPPPDVDVDLSHRLGELHEEELGRPDEALRWYERAFARDPGHRPTIAALERFLDEGRPSRVHVAGLLEPVYEKLDDIPRQVRAREILLSALPTEQLGGPEELTHLTTLLRLTARRLGDAEAAWRYAARVFERTPSDDKVRAELAELADVVDGHAERARLLAAAEERVAAGDEPLARDLAWELGEVYSARLGQLDLAEQAWLRVLARDDQHGGAFEALDRLYRDKERYRDLRELLRRRLELVSDDAERRALLFRIADLDEQLLDAPDEAARSYEQVLVMEPASERAFTALDRLHRQAGRWRQLDDLYAAAVQNHEGDAGVAARADLKARRGALRLDRIDDGEGACDLFEDALAEVPGHAASRAGLEQLLGRPALQKRVARLLEPLYLDEDTPESWEKLIGVLEAQREGAATAESTALLGRIATIAEERLEDPARAFDRWRAAFRLDPADVALQGHVDRLATALGRFNELAAAWEEGVSLADPVDVGLRRSFLERAARLYELVLDDGERAKAAWKGVLALDPRNPESARPAAQALARLHQDEEAWPELIEMLRLQAGWAEEEPDTSSGEPRGAEHFLRQVATIEEELLLDGAAAVATHRRILERDPTDTGSLDALERLYTAAADHAALAETLRRRLELTADPAARRALLWRIAVIVEERLTPPGRALTDAIAAYAAVLDESPEDGPALEALTRLHAAAERHTDLLEVLERRLALAVASDQPVADRQALRARIAELQVGPLAMPAQALERFREMLAEDSDDPTARAGLERMLGDEELRLVAAEILEPVYETRGEVEQLVRLCELLADHSPELAERVRRLRMVASLSQSRLELLPAFGALARAARLGAGEPEIPAILDEIEHVVDAATPELDARLVALYREIGPDVLDTPVQERVYLTVAARSRSLGDRGTAREYYRRILEAQPEHPQALDAIEAIYREGGEHEPLLEICLRRADLVAEDPDARARYLLEAARLCEGPVGRVDEAISLYQQVLELQPADTGAEKHLEALYEGAGRFADLADLLERRLGFADDTTEAVALHHRLGAIFERDLGDTVRALEHYRAALSGDPNHGGAITALERFLEHPDHRAEAAEVLEPVYTGRHDWKALIRIYEIRLEGTEDPARRLQLTRRIARLHEETLEDLDGAFGWYARLFREAPDDKGVRDQLARIANFLGDGAHSRLAEVYEGWLSDVYEETPGSTEVLRTLAALYDGRLADPDRAKVCYLRLLRSDPGDQQAFALLESSLRRAERYTDLASAIREVAENTADATRRRELLWKIAELRRGPIADPDGAISVLREIQELDPGDDAAVRALDDLFTARERWRDLAEHLAGQIERDPGFAPALKLRLGHLFHQKLRDPGAAVDQFEQVIGPDPESAEATVAIRAVEGLLGEAEVRMRVAQLLDPIYRARDDWQRLVVTHEAELEFEVDKPRRVELLREMARFHEERDGNLTLAFEALARAWAEEADEGRDREEPLYLQLAELAAQTDSWAELLTALQRAVDGDLDGETRARLLSRIGEIQERQQGDTVAAIATWRKVVALAPEEVPAWKALERLLAVADRPGELVSVLERRAELSQQPYEQKALYYRVADLQEKALDLPERAIATWKQVLLIDDADSPALTALERLYRDTGRLGELADVLQRQVELAATEAERRPLRAAVAAVYEESGDIAAAITSWRANLAQDPHDGEATAALLRIFQREQQWPDLIETLDAAAALAAREERDELRYRAARVVETELHDALGAVARYGEVLAGSPRHAASRQALEALLRDDDAREAAAAVLEPLYREGGEAAPLVELLEARLSADGGRGGGEARPAILVDLARLQEDKLGDPAAAFGAWSRLLADEPGDARAVGELERLAASLGNWYELGKVLADRLDSTFEPSAQRLLAAKLARLAEERLDEPQRAIDCYRKVLELGGTEEGAGDLAVLAALDRLLARDPATNAVELGEILEREAHLCTDRADAGELWFRLGQLRHAHLRDEDGALAAFREAIERRPEHAGTRAALERMLTSPDQAVDVLDLLDPIYEREGDHLRRVWLAEGRLTLTTDPDERAALLARIARLHEQEIGDLGRALEATARALAEVPTDLPLVDEMVRIGSSSGRLAEAGAALESILERGMNADAAREIGLRAGRLYDLLGDEPRAEQRYLAVLDADPESAEALVALERIYRGRRKNDSLCEILERRAQQQTDPGNRKALLAEVALLREGPLGDEPGAVRAWQQVLEVDEADEYALTALASLHEGAGRYRELIDVLDQQARFAPTPASQVEIKRRVAQVYAERLGDLGRAVETWREVLDIQPDSLGALTWLEDLEARRGDFRAVQEVLLQQLGVVGAGPAQVPIYRRLASLAATRLDSPDDAISYLGSLLEISPEDESAMIELERALDAQGRYYDLVDLLRRHAQLSAAMGEREQEVALLVRAADLLEEKLTDAVGATEILESILARDPGNLRALGSLAKLYESARDFERCREVLERAALLGGTGPDAARIQVRLGRIEAELGDAARSQACYQRALQLDPACLPALDALEAAARAAQDFPSVAALLSRRAEVVPEAARRPLWLELARLYTDKLRDPAAAVPWLERARAQTPTDAAVLEALADACQAAGRPDAALPIVKELLEATVAASKGRKSKDAARLHHRMGELSEALGDATRAAEQYSAAYAIDAGHPATLAALGRLHMAAAEWDKARRVYRSLLLQNLDGGTIRKADVYLALGEIHERTNEAPKAVGMYERGLELDPGSEALKRALARAKAAR